MEAKMIRLGVLPRLMGLFWVVTALLWALACVAGVIYGAEWLDNTQTGLERDLGLVVTNIESVQGLLVETGDVLSETQLILTAVNSSTLNISAAMTEIRPFLWKSKDVLTHDIPEALDDLDESMPTVIETAKTVDETLSWLAGIKLVIPIPDLFGDDIVLDLGVEYAPVVPLDVALEDVSSSLDGVPDDLRTMKEDFDNMDRSVYLVREDIQVVGETIAQTNAQLGEVVPEVENMNASLELLQESLQATIDKTPASIGKAKVILRIVAGLILFSQIPLLYFGLVLFRGNIRLSN